MQRASTEQPRYASVTKRSLRNSTPVSKPRSTSRSSSAQESVDSPPSPTEHSLNITAESEESMALAEEFQQMWNQAQYEAKQLHSQRLFELVLMCYGLFHSLDRIINKRMNLPQ